MPKRPTFESRRLARTAKALSQAALAKLAGVPQSHISKIENTGIDLRLSSLTELARALDLELMLVPRKVVPAARSLIRQAQPTPISLTTLAPRDDLAKKQGPRPAYSLEDDDG